MSSDKLKVLEANYRRALRYARKCPAMFLPAANAALDEARAEFKAARAAAKPNSPAGTAPWSPISDLHSDGKARRP